MIYKKVITLLLLFFFINQLIAKDDSLKKQIDTLYIKDYYSSLAVWANTFAKSNQITIFDTKSKNTLTYFPNISATFGPGFSYKWFGLDMSFISLGKKSQEQFGKTEKLDIQGRFQMKKFMADAFVQYYKGFYANEYFNDKTDEDYPILNDSLSLLRPDLVEFMVGGSFLYSFNWDKFSLKSSFSQLQKQKKSKGTWLLGIYMNFFVIGADSVIMPHQIRENFDTSAWFLGASSFNYGLTGGYIHTFVYKNWYATLSLIPGFGVQKYQYAVLGDTAVNKDNSRMVSRLQSRLSMGYNSEKIYAGLSIISENVDFNNSTSAFLKHNFGVVRVFVGYRFHFKKKRK